MNQQINVRMPEKLLKSARNYSKKHGFSSVQELIKEAVREKLFPDITKEELKLIKRLAVMSQEKNLFGTEKELMNKLENV